MAGIKITKNYVSTSISNTNLANNWMVLVYGVTSQGSTKPTLVQNYSTFIDIFGQPVSGVLTHAYMRFLLDSGVPVLFQRVIDEKALVKASTIVKNNNDKELFSIEANDTYTGLIGNKISIDISENNTTKACVLQIKLDSKIVETFSLGQDTQNDMGSLVYNFINQASASISGVSKYVKFKIIDTVAEDWNNTFPVATINLENGSEPENTFENAIALLKNPESTIFKNVKLLNAPTYYPQLRFVTTGGLCDSDKDSQEAVL